jgi:outer membrane protein TolC
MRIFCLAGLLLLGLIATQADPVEEQLRARMRERQTDRVLSLQDCIKLALENNLDVQIRRLDPEIAGFRLRATYSSYDPEFSLSAQHSYELSPGGLDAQGRTYSGVESETDAYRAGLSGLLPWGTF